MTHADINHAAPTGPAPNKSRKQRLAVMVILGVCGVLIALVLVSNPRVQAQISSGVSALKDQFATTSQTAPASVEATATQVAPTTRVRVRRAGVISQD